MFRTLVALALALAPMTASARAADGVGAFNTAADNFLILVDQRLATQAILPRVTSAEAAPYVTAIRSPALLADLRASDVRTVFGVCQKSLAIVKRYSLAGTQRGVDGRFTTTGSDADITYKNTVFYQDEVTPFFNFSVDCLGVALPKIASVWDGLSEEEKGVPARRDGMSELRAGAMEFFAGSIGNITETAFSLGNRRQNLDTTVRNAAAYALVLSPEQRASLAATARAAMSGADPYFRSQLGKIVSILEAAPCESLCRI